MPDSDRKKLPRALRELRDGAAGLLTGAESELTRAVGRALDRIGLKGNGDVPARVREAVSELVSNAHKRREEVERRVDEGVRSSLARMRRPLSAELQALRTRLEKVQQRVDALSRRRRKGST